MAQLTDKQKRFCEEYLIDMNGTQAAIRAGYSKKTAHVQASQTLSISKVQEYLQELRSEQQERVRVDADRVLQELCAIAFSKITDVVNIEQFDISFRDDIVPGAQAAIQSMVMIKSSHESNQGANSTERIQLKMHGKLGALKELGNHLGLFRELDIAIAVLKQYGIVEPTETGHVFHCAQL